MDRREVLNRLLAMWSAYPQLRFGQFLSNLAAAERRDLFYIEDAELVKIAEKWAKEDFTPN